MDHLVKRSSITFLPLAIWPTLIEAPTELPEKYKSKKKNEPQLLA
jgi:hypothetical protein